ncbi:MAG TPA: SDR family oxidoreductase [Candidatus Methylomirabilis sp.]|nr:SDR family oxidoreductase [Candidatus Methylomirabilis sp.]
MKLRGKVAIVTGGGRGIGRAAALALGREGAAVALAARSAVEIEAVAREVRDLGAQAIPVATDVACEDDIARLSRRTLETFGRIDILVNNAGIGLPLRDVVDLGLDEWSRVLQVNLTGPFLCAKAVLPSMIRQRWGKIINISSLGGQVGVAGNSAYGASKAGLLLFTRCLAAEVKRHGIDVNAICPSGTDTRLLREMGRAEGRTNLMQPEEIANTILFLVSPESSAVTGTVIETYGLSNPLFGPLTRVEQEESSGSS